MRNIIRALWNWTPPFVWMSFIFFMSSHSRVSVTSTYIIDFVIFKTIHMIEYAVLYILLFRAFYRSHNPKIQLTYKYKAAIIIAILFAVTDEFHQLSTPTRQGTIRDIVIDSMGVFLMYSYSKKYLSFVKKFFI